MKKHQAIIRLSIMVLLLGACSKSNFLDKKPSMDIVVAKTLTDFNNLLENTTIIRRTGSLAQMSADDYTILDVAVWQGLSNNMQRNAYIWAKDIYGGDNGILDWNALYTSVFYANAVLDGLESAAEKSTAQGQYLKGWALFVRAYAFYDLTRNFCKAYDPSTAATDLGIPLRSTSAIEHIAQRATLQESFDCILGDLKLAENLLPAERPSANLNRPSKIAVYALMARIYLDMRNYGLAETYADKCLGLYSTLIDYNTVSPTAAVPFSTTNDELIYNTHQIPYNSELTGALPSLAAKISPELIGLYGKGDLRLPIYFAFTAATNSYSIKSGYYGAGLYPFTGLATDEVYLIKAECLARRNEPDLAMERLNFLLTRRFPNTAAQPYQPLVATSSLDALDKVLLERRKELVWRGIRWHDLKRLNKEGAQITLRRELNGVVYTIPPNDPRWVFPIPDEEISESGIRQNIR